MASASSLDGSTCQVSPAHQPSCSISPAITMAPTSTAEVETHAVDSSSPPPSDKPPKTLTTFHDLPAELRNYIYDLSGCLKIYQCLDCNTVAYRNTPRVWFSTRGSTNSALSLVAHRWDACCRRTPGAGEQGRATKARFRIKASSDPLVRHHAPTCRDSRCARLRQSSTTTAQPDISKVSKQVQADTLPMFYGGYQFYSTFFSNADEEGATLLRWLTTIGPLSAALLRDLVLVYSRRQDWKYLRNKLMPELEEAGVRVEDGVVRLVKLEHPFCHCGKCVLDLLRKKD